MPTEDEMTVSERRKYVKLMKGRYGAAKRKERGHLLTEMEQVTGLHRKSLTRLMHAASLERKKRVRPRERAGFGTDGPSSQYRPAKNDSHPVSGREFRSDRDVAGRVASLKCYSSGGPGLP